MGGPDGLEGGGGSDQLYGGTAGNTRGTATDTLLGGVGDDQLYLSSTDGGDAALLTGGAGADRFVLGDAAADNAQASYNNNFANPGTHFSTQSAPDRITDFNAGEGDLLRSGIIDGLGGSNASIPLVWRG